MLFERVSLFGRSERLELASFTRPMYADMFHVLAWRSPQTNMLETAFNVARQPFDDELWLVLLLTYVACGVAMWLIEGAKNPDDFPTNVASDSVVEAIFKSLQVRSAPHHLLTPAHTLLD